VSVLMRRGLYCLIVLPLLVSASEKSTAVIDDISADQVRSAYRPLGDIPIIVLTHQAFPRGPAETQAQRDAKNKLWIDLHNQIAAMSTRGKRLSVENTGHYIQMEQPQVVVDSILEVLRATRER
jgi:pimeloyl-ACP methyl ester carboxylesterase